MFSRSDADPRCSYIWKRHALAVVVSVVAVTGFAAPPADASWTQQRAQGAAESDGVTIFGSTVPKAAVSKRSSARTLGVAFRSVRAGFITGVRFLNTGANSGKHSAALWSSSGRRLAWANSVDETASGWQTAAFAAPVAIEADTTYIAGYFAPKGRYVSSRK